MLFGKAEEELQAAEDAKIGKKVSKKKNTWKQMKNKMLKKEDAQLELLKQGVHEKIRFTCCDHLLLFLSQVVCSHCKSEENGRCCPISKCCRNKRMDVLSKLYVEGEEKLTKEFSMDKLLRSLREIKLLLKLKGDLTKE